MMLRYAALAALGATLASTGTIEAQNAGPRVSAVEYEGWRHYSVQCARCHGQDVTGNPVAANLLASARQGGPVAEEDAFVRVVTEGRPARGMPSFKDIMRPEQIAAVYAYVKGRADGRIPVGRPAKPAE
jgi:mono/diheme cytochrome c family protein